MKRICSKCGNEVRDDNVKFCPKCGTIFPPQGSWYCEMCGKLNDAKAHFCQSCGTGHGDMKQTAEMEPASVEPPKWKKIVQHVYFKYACIVLFIMLLGGIGSFYYFTNMNEEHYLTKYAEASRTIDSANSILLTNTKADILKKDSLDATKKQLQEQQNTIDSLTQEFTKQKPFKNYESPHKSMIDLLQKESAVFAQTLLVLTKPLDGATDDVIANIKADTATIKELGSKIQVPNTSFGGTDLSVLPQQLTSYVAEQRKLNARAAELGDFFGKMDKVISDYDGAKTDLSGMLASSRNGGMIWKDYFDVIDKAKYTRSGIKAQVNTINVPAGTERLQQLFTQVLTESIRYCELMRISANLSFHNYYIEANRKETEAQKLNKQVQDDYESFISQYNSTKQQLLKQ